MHDRHTFKYAVIRVVPKVEREEFFNVGVILYCRRKKFLDLKYHIDPNKLKAFSADLEPEWLDDHLGSWKAICAGVPTSGPIGALDPSERFGWLTACRSTILQSSETHSGLCTDPLKELDGLFEKYVL